jgi:hypothetical protein
MKSPMSRLQIGIDGLVEVLNGESKASVLPEQLVSRLRQLCGDLEELERIRVAIAQLEPHATDPVSIVNPITGRAWAWPNWQLKNPAARELSASGKRILERINALLKCLRTREAVMLAADARGLRLIRWHPIEPKHLYESVLLGFVLELLESGHLRRLRHCERNECRRWFYAGTDWQKYCSRNCRQREAAKSEVFKERRKLYMQKRREDEKEQEKRSKEQAKRELAKKGRRK